MIEWDAYSVHNSNNHFGHGCISMLCVSMQKRQKRSTTQASESIRQVGKKTHPGDTA